MDKNVNNSHDVEKVPLEQVLKDMYEDSGVQSAARSYYYNNYATPEEQVQMDREDRITNIVVGTIWTIIVIAAIVSVISLFTSV